MKTESRLLLLYAGWWSTLAIVIRGRLIDTISVMPPESPKDIALLLLERPFLKEVRKVVVRSPRPRWEEDMHAILGPTVLEETSLPQWIEAIAGFAASLDREIGLLHGVA